MPVSSLGRASTLRLDITRLCSNSGCIQGSTNASNGRSYMAGTMVWTLSDYYGEARQGWPGVSSTYGAFDLAGYEKGAAWWYRSWWRDNTPVFAEDRPRPLPGVPEVPACRVWGDRWDQYVGKVNNTLQPSLSRPALPSL